jgi:hypothetical protein
MIGDPPVSVGGLQVTYISVAVLTEALTASGGDGIWLAGTVAWAGDDGPLLPIRKTDDTLYVYVFSDGKYRSTY